jgi:oxygen-dependent protoporphyrinogen oxidase
MVGGDGDHESIKLTDGELLGLVTRDLSDILGISGEPEFVKMYRWTHGIPQYRVGHGETMKRIHSELKRNPGLHLAGNAYYGIGLNDCVKQAHRIAQNIN